MTEGDIAIIGFVVVMAILGVGHIVTWIWMLISEIRKDRTKKRLNKEPNTIILSRMGIK
ncbi:MAG: hypothetical protein KAS32_27755 [Candidatus Peribacteraceae bacterium]|nr:hypothetical protein [Candidatus Peribacteraceae bacterium]